MPFSSFQLYIHSILSYVPWTHWTFLGIMALVAMVFITIHYNPPAYNSIAFGLTFFYGLFLIEIAVVIRLYSELHHSYGFDLNAEFNRILHGDKWERVQLLSNIAAFVPFGLFLSEFLASTKRYSAKRWIRLATLFGFGLSLCIECLQLVIRLGLFELTDLVMNTLGAFVGALISAGVRKVVGERSRSVRTQSE